MTRFSRLLRLLPTLGLYVACSEPGAESGGIAADQPTSASGTGAPAATPGGAGSAASSPPFDWSSVSALGAEQYLRKLAPSVVGRVMTADELARVQSQAGSAISPIVESWVKEPTFVLSARRFLETSLAVSGQTPEGINYNLPGNLAEFIVRNGRPWSEIITSGTCYDDSLAPITCDTGAPYTAGVITTRAYMISRISRYNLQRASALLRNFACRQYPMEDELQPHVEKTWLIPMFQAQTPAEQTDPRAKNGFGQGAACYTCHGQFSVHSQLFVKFDELGLWQASANGLQDEADELGRSTNHLMASHFSDPTRAQHEGVDVFGKPVANLAEAAAVLAKSPTFVECAANRYLDNVLGVQPGTISYDNSIFVDLGQRLRASSADPTFPEIAAALLTDPLVVVSIIHGLTGEAP